METVFSIFMQDILEISNCLKGTLLKTFYWGFPKTFKTTEFLSILQKMYGTIFFRSVQIQHSNTATLIKWLHYNPFSGKFATISKNSHKKHFFFESDFVKAEILNCRLATLKKREQFYTTNFLKFLKYQNILSFLSIFKKGICSGVSSPVGCRLWSYKFIKKKLSYIRFSGIFPKFLVQLFQSTLMKTFAIVFSKNSGCWQYSCVLIKK